METVEKPISTRDEVKTDEIDNNVATVAPPLPKLNRFMRRKLMKRFGAFKRLSRIGRVRV